MKLLLLLLALPMLALLFLGEDRERDPAHYFFHHRTERGWVLDRSDNPRVVSVAANGFGMAAWALAAKRGEIPREQAIEWINTCIDNTTRVNQGNHGWLYHFVDREGQPVYYKAVSSIDTALFYHGARRAADILGDDSLKKKVNDLIAAVDTHFMLTNAGTQPEKRYFSHGFVWKDGKPEFLRFDWEEYSEGILIYRLFGVPYEPTATRYHLPLFVYYYPLCFYNDPSLVDLLGRAMDWQENRHGISGFTACDGPRGYKVNEPDVVSPLALSTCEVFQPERARRSLSKIPVDRLTPAYHLKTGWSSPAHIAIDEGAYMLAVFFNAKSR